MAVSVSVWQVRLSFGSNEVLKGIDLDIAPGELVTLLGASGSGKSTLLNVIAGLLPTDSGDVAFDGRSVQGLTPQGRNVGFLFQSYALFPHLTVAENVAFALRARRRDKKTQARVAREMLELVHLADTATRRPTTLSGGQRQRVALARALASEPSVLLLDEPMAALDKHLREQMQVEVRRIQREVGITTISVTHDQVEAMTMSDRIAIVHDGRVVQIGAPEELYARPVDEFVAKFLGEANIVDVDLPGGTRGRAVVRPENLRLTPPGESRGRYVIEGVLRLASYQGSRYRVEITDDHGEVVIASVDGASSRDGLVVGDRVGLECRSPEQVHVLS